MPILLLTSLLQSLPGILRFHTILNSKYSYRYSRQEAGETRIGTAIENSSELKAMFKDWCKVCNIQSDLQNILPVF